MITLGGSDCPFDKEFWADGTWFVRREVNYQIFFV